MAKTERYFGPRQSGEPVLACVFFASAFGLIYLAAIAEPLSLPPDPRYRGDFYMLLFAAVLIAGGVAAWRWRRFRSEMKVSAEGVFISSQGMRPVRRTTLTWADLVRIELRIEIVFRGEDLYFFDFFAKGEERRHSVILNGLQDDRGEILTALFEVAGQNGYSLTGPRPDHISAWFSGMNWKVGLSAD